MTRKEMNISVGKEESKLVFVVHINNLCAKLKGIMGWPIKKKCFVKKNLF